MDLGTTLNDFRPAYGRPRTKHCRGRLAGRRCTTWRWKIRPRLGVGVSSRSPAQLVGRSAFEPMTKQIRKLQELGHLSMGCRYLQRNNTVGAGLRGYECGRDRVVTWLDCITMAM